ncbi:MAG TPA: cytochrome c oxidase assembly factor Coa1 family protein [Candidatus Acidoferrum sp.]|jgi:hypothetical protein
MWTLVIVLIFTVPHFAMTHTDVYRAAVATAHNSRRFKETLGEPVKEGWYSDGKLSWNPYAPSEIVIPVRGKIRSGNLKVLAKKESEGWSLLSLSLELADSHEVIDLLSN